MKIKNFNSLDRMAEQLVLDFVAQAKKNIAEKDFFSVVLSGGNTPKNLFAKLAEYDKTNQNIQWDKIFFFWGDERCVSHDTETSNYFFANKLLFSKIKIPKKNIFIIPTEPPFENSAETYSETIKKFFNFRKSLPKFDLVYLGMGDDGHVASLFPYTKSLEEKDKIVIAVEPPKTVEPAVPRISMTFPVLKNAKKVQVLISGKNKIELLEKISKNNFTSEQYPVKEFLNLPKTNVITTF